MQIVNMMSGGNVTKAEAHPHLEDVYLIRGVSALTAARWSTALTVLGPILVVYLTGGGITPTVPRDNVKNLFIATPYSVGAYVGCDRARESVSFAARKTPQLACSVAPSTSAHALSQTLSIGQRRVFGRC